MTPAPTLSPAPEPVLTPTASVEKVGSIPEATKAPASFRKPEQVDISHLVFDETAFAGIWTAFTDERVSPGYKAYLPAAWPIKASYNADRMFVLSWESHEKDTDHAGADMLYLEYMPFSPESYETLQQLKLVSSLYEDARAEGANVTKGKLADFEGVFLTVQDLPLEEGKKGRQKGSIDCVDFTCTFAGESPIGDLLIVGISCFAPARDISRVAGTILASIQSIHSDPSQESDFILVGDTASSGSLTGLRRFLIPYPTATPTPTPSPTPAPSPTPMPPASATILEPSEAEIIYETQADPATEGSPGGTNAVAEIVSQPDYGAVPEFISYPGEYSYEGYSLEDLGSMPNPDWAGDPVFDPNGYEDW